MNQTHPKYPLYIISKGRWESRLTSRALERMGVPYRIVVEEQEREQYAAVIDPSKILILDPAYQRDYDACMELAPGQSTGSGPARNFVWDHAVSEGHARHWILDDNINPFYRLNRNAKIKVQDGAAFRAMEDFVDRYENVALAGPNYDYFAKARQSLPPFVLNTRLYSCILILNAIPFRWRCRYNEDVDLSLRVLKAGYCTIQFNAFLQGKIPTQVMQGGNTDAFYAAEGTLPKSRMLVNLHPDVAQLVWKFHRWHHHVDYRPFKHNRLIRRPDVEIPDGLNEYGMRLTQIAARPQGVAP
jgi:hypothetical protein